MDASPDASVCLGEAIPDGLNYGVAGFFAAAFLAAGFLAAGFFAAVGFMAVAFLATAALDFAEVSDFALAARSARWARA